MGIFDTVKQLKDLREQAKKMQEILSAITIKESAKNDALTITLNGNMDVLDVRVLRDAFSSDDELSKTLQETMQAALKRAQVEAGNAMRTTGGLNIPGLS